MDANSNEYNGLDIQSFPTFLFFKGSNTGQEKLNSKIRYQGLKNVTMMINFLMNNTHNPIKDIISIPNEDQIEEEERLEEETEKFEQEEESNFNKSPDSKIESEEGNYDWDEEITNSAKNKDVDINLEDFGGMNEGLRNMKSDDDNDAPPQDIDLDNSKFDQEENVQDTNDSKKNDL